MALTGLAIASAIGLAKSELVDRPQENRNRALAANTQRYSPWTGMQAQPVKPTDDLGTMMQYGSTGAMMGANMKAADKGTGNPWGSGGVGNQGTPAPGGAPSLTGYDYAQNPYDFFGTKKF